MIFLAGGAIADRRAWSGTVHYASRALAKRVELVPIEAPATNRALRALRAVMRSSGVDPIREPLCSSLMSRQLGGAIARIGADAVFVLGASHIAAALCDRFPVFHCSDATFAAMVGYYPEFSGLSARTVRAGHALEQKAISRSVAAIVSSDWAAQSVRLDYHRMSGVHVVPFGANVDEMPAADAWQPTGKCALTFVGVDWHRKGADVAVEAAGLLNQRGVPAVLDVVGCLPPAGRPNLPGFVRLHGFLRKDVGDEYQRLSALMAKADFLLVPTRSEAYGLVFCEAAAYGTPAVARRTGGVPTIIQDDVTGALLPTGAGAAAYADRIEALWAEPRRYREMRQRAFARARSVLNWDAWAARVEAIVSNALILAPGAAAVG